MSNAAETPKVLEVAPGVFVRQEIDNMTWIDMGDHVIVVDALEHAEKESDVLAGMRQAVGDKRVRFVLNTHTHYDHVALNAAFERRGAQVVNAANTTLPRDGREFAGPRRSLRMIQMGGAHTDEDCVVHLCDDSVLLVGDIFGWGLIPLTVNLRQDTQRVLLETYARLIGLNARVVVPGHGPLCDTATLRRYVDYYHWLVESVRQGISTGRSDQDLLAEIAPPADMSGWWRFVAWKHNDSLTKVIKAVRKGWI